MNTDIFSTVDIDNLLATIDNKDLRAGTVGVDKTGYSEHRSSDIMFLPRQQYEGVYNVCWDIFRTANIEYFGYNIDRVPTCQYSVYSADKGGIYNWHKDSYELGGEEDRKLTLVIQLSHPEEYEGGNLMLKDVTWSAEELISLKRKGTVIVFPSELEHKVSLVTKGTRVALVSWALGPPLI
jgi:PKHD-type hydroxylase